MMYQLLKLQRMAQQPIPPRNLVRLPYLKLPAPHNSVIHGTECHVTKWGTYRNWKSLSYTDGSRTIQSWMWEGTIN